MAGEIVGNILSQDFIWSALEKKIKASKSLRYSLDLGEVPAKPENTESIKTLKMSD